ncbi:unnamed protein product [Vicia faba]|uniref:Uncharacterized protein n=1 Tax=Vicia faba TaxID=3906 RepID=A0AAV0Z263_VICFA|nr:unnamed protein product [Vicia faba]
MKACSGTLMKCLKTTIKRRPEGRLLHLMLHPDFELVLAWYATGLWTRYLSYYGTSFELSLFLALVMVVNLGIMDACLSPHDGKNDEDEVNSKIGMSNPTFPPLVQFETSSTFTNLHFLRVNHEVGGKTFLLSLTLRLGGVIIVNSEVGAFFMASFAFVVSTESNSVVGTDLRIDFFLELDSPELDESYAMVAGGEFLESEVEKDKHEVALDLK